MSSEGTKQETIEKLLEAAGEVFAERGFRNATIREICKRAGVNVAAVNYHFYDKDGLYSAVLRYAHKCATEKYAPTSGLGDDATAEQKLRAHIRSLLLRMFDHGRQAWHGKLMSREMTEPTQALDTLVDQQIRPRHEALKSTLRELLGEHATDDQLRSCAWSIVGQCLFYYNAQPVIRRLHPQMTFEPDAVERIAEHITQFSLGALREMRAQLEAQPR